MATYERVFVDSNFFVALFNVSDTLSSLYPQAAQLAARLDQERRPLVISNFIFLEVVTVLSQRRGRVAAIDIGTTLAIHPLITIIHVDEALQQETWAVFKSTKNKNAGFVDCSIPAVMRAEGITTLLTFDLKDFKPLARSFHFRLYG